MLPWKGKSTGFFVVVFTLAFYINLSIKTQARVKDAETSFKAGKDLRPASSHFTSRHQVCTCSRLLFDCLRKPTKGGRERPWRRGNEFCFWSGLVVAECCDESSKGYNMCFTEKEETFALRKSQ